MNSTFTAADLRVTLSGIRVHNDAGYGGGAKAVLPGVSALDTIAYAPTVIATGNKTCGQVKIQILYNSKLKPAHVFAGDVVQAHRAAAGWRSTTTVRPRP